MGDPTLDAVRERLDIPVVGPARVSMLYAAELSHKFSIVTTVKNIVVSIENLAKGLGLNEKLASVRVVNIPVLNLKNKEKLVKALIDESVKAVEDDGAHAIILGCTGMMGVAEDLSKALVEKGHKVPVIYPVAVSIKYLETLISLNLAQSKKTYMHPPEKERNVLEKLR
jgi:allantoin racemase